MAIIIPSVAQYQVSGGRPKYRRMNRYDGKDIDVCPLIKHDPEEFLYLYFLHKTGETR